MIAANSIIGGTIPVPARSAVAEENRLYREDLRLAARPCALDEMVDSCHRQNMQEAGGPQHFFKREPTCSRNSATKYPRRVRFATAKQNPNYS